jgi:hypothetical protein
LLTRYSGATRGVEPGISIRIFQLLDSGFARCASAPE